MATLPDATRFHIDGKWVQPVGKASAPMINAALYDRVAQIAVETAEALSTGPKGDVGLIANANQYQIVKDYIATGLKEGASLLTGGSERPAPLDEGYFIQPTIFADVTPGMVIEQEEIFGPVLTLTRYETVAEAISIANNSPYGLSGAIWSKDLDRANQVAAELRTGMVHINGAGLDSRAPFGGYKSSGNGREWGVHGFEEFLELKSVYGAEPT